MKKYFDIFVRFCRVGALTFGGGLSMLPIIERELSEGEKPYLEKEAISDNYAMAQCAPGIIAVNTSILCGYQIGGTLGGIVAAFGVCVPSVIIILIIATVMSSFMTNHYVAIALMGIRSGVCALILNTIMGLWKKSIIDKITFGIFAFALMLLVIVDLSPVYSVFLGAFLGIAAHLIMNRKSVTK